MSAAALAAIFGTSIVVSLMGALSTGLLLTVEMRAGVRRNTSRCAQLWLPSVRGAHLVALGASGIGYAA